MTFVPFDEVVAESILTIGAAGDDEIAKQFAKTFIWRGLQSLGNSDERITVAKIYPKNLLLKKPKDLKQLLDIALYDSADNLLPHQFHTGGKRIYPQTDATYYTSTDENNETVSEFLGRIDLSEDQNNIIIGTNGSDVAYAQIRYVQYPLDSMGLPLIREDEVEALTLYVRYKWSQRLNQNQAEIRENKFAWQQAADICKAAKKVSNGEQKKTMAAERNRMLPNFNRSSY